jgi:hypothetical protein
MLCYATLYPISYISPYPTLQERGGKPELVFMDQDGDNAAFWAALGGHRDITDPGPADDAVTKTVPKLFRISDASGAVVFEPVPLEDGKLKKTLLDTNDVFLVDVGSKVYIWVGKGANLAEKKEGMPRAAAYLTDTRGSASLPVERVAETSETSLFKAEFAVWDTNMPKPAQAKAAAAAVDTPVDVTAFLQRQQQNDAPVDDGSGVLKCQRVEDFKLVDVPADKYGNFYGGDSYVLSYTYTKPGSSKQEVIIYFWQGEGSSQDERGASALLAKEMDDSMGGVATQVRVVQGKEPAHFRQLFRGNMVVHAGGKASGFKNRTEGDSYDTDGIALFLIKGTDAMNTSAKQVEEKACALNSSDAFVLVTPTHCYAWKGRGASSDEQTMAIHIANKLAGEYNGCGGREALSVEEGAEPEEFWAALGGQVGCAMICYAMLCYAMPCCAMLCHAMLCYAMLCYAMLCYTMLYYAMLCCAAVLCYYDTVLLLYYYYTAMMLCDDTITIMILVHYTITTILPPLYYHHYTL